MKGLDVRDDLETLKSLMNTFVTALNNKEFCEATAKDLSSVIFFVVIPFIEQIDEKLRKD